MSARHVEEKAFVACACAAHRPLRPASSAGYGSLVSANCARTRTTSAAFKSACRVNPQAIQAKSLLCSTLRQQSCRICCTPATNILPRRRPPGERRFQPSRQSNVEEFRSPHRAALNFSPLRRHVATRLRTVPFAEQVIARRFSFSTTMKSALSTIRRDALCSA